FGSSGLLQIDVALFERAALRLGGGERLRQRFLLRANVFELRFRGRELGVRGFELVANARELRIETRRIRCTLARLRAVLDRLDPRRELRDLSLALANLIVEFLDLRAAERFLRSTFFDALRFDREIFLRELQLRLRELLCRRSLLERPKSFRDRRDAEQR